MRAKLGKGVSGVRNMVLGESGKGNGLWSLIVAAEYVNRTE